MQTETAVACRAHPEVAAVYLCDSCNCPMCKVCAFDTATGEVCPDCMGSGLDPQTRRNTSKYALGSILLAALGCVLMIGLLLLGVASDDAAANMAASLVGLLLLAALLTGLTLGLVSRDHARRTGSPLSLIGTTANAVMLVVYLALVVIGLSMGS